MLRSHRERCLKITKLGPTQICSLVVCSLLQQTMHDHSTSVDAHGAGASTVPCNSLAVVNLRPCLVKNSLVPTCLVPGTKHGLDDMLKDHVTPSSELIETRCDAWQGQLLEKVPERLPPGLLSLVPNAHF